MRFLFADSEPFVRNYDFLATFRGFLSCASHCVAAATQIDQLGQDMAERSEDLGHHAQALDEFEKAIVSAVEVARARSLKPEAVAETAQQVIDYVERSVELAKGRNDAAHTQHQSTVASEREALLASVRAAVDQFLLREELDVLSTGFRMELVGEGYEMFAVCELSGGVLATYKLAADESPDWQAPRRVADLVGEMQIQIGLKKKWLKKDLTRELAQLGELTIVRAELAGDLATITLRRRPDVPNDDLTLVMQRQGELLGCEITRPSERAEESTFPAVPDDLGKLEALWIAVEEASSRTLLHKREVTAALLDGEDMYPIDRTLVFVNRYVDLYAPVVEAIAQRSPSDKELSLKLEHDDGRREELYLRKDELVELVGQLDDRGMQIFAPLDVFPVVEVEVD